MLIKIAGAGAGKTTTMAESIIEKHKELSRDKNIYCITFTNSAVCCIERKLLDFYGTLPSNIKLSTIHSFLYQDIIKPFYYLLYGTQFENISSIALSSKPNYRRMKISELEKKGVIHVDVFTERAKWVICKKSSDGKKIKEKRLILLNLFKKYCGYIFIDEAQDMDKNMLEIVRKFNELSIPMELIGDPKQDLKSSGSLRKISDEFPEDTEYITNCHRCPQNHLDISNILIAESERQYSDKRKGDISVYYESETNIKALIDAQKYDLMYISEKNPRYDTSVKLKNTTRIETLFQELEQFFLEEESMKSKNDLLIKQVSYYFASKLIESYSLTKNPKNAMRVLTTLYTLNKPTYAKVIRTLQSNDDFSDDKIKVFSIDRVKGQEGENCLFILTKDLAPYLFLENKKDNRTKNRLYVALTRSSHKITIVISEEVENHYGRDFIVKFLKQYNI